MKTKIVLVLVSSLLIVMVLVAAYFVMNATKTMMVYVDPGEVVRSVGQDFTINVDVSNVANLYAWECKLGWNTTVLDLVSVTEGSFLGKNGSTFFNYVLNKTLGHVVIDCTLLGEVKGVSGSGVLASIRLRVKNNGTCELDLYNTQFVDDSEQMIVHTVNSGRFSSEL